MLADALAEGGRLKAQQDVLEQAEQSLAGFADGAKLLLDAARHSQLNGTKGTLSAVLDVPAEFETAIAAALGEYADAILVESGVDAEQALSLLDEKQTGRASILPLDWLRPERTLSPRLGTDILGVAADLVEAPAELRPAVDLLLGQVLIVRDRGAARRALAGNPNSSQAVTLKGEVFHASGQILGGKTTTVTAISRSRKRRELLECLTRNEHQTESLETDC